MVETTSFKAYCCSLVLVRNWRVQLRAIIARRRTTCLSPAWRTRKSVRTYASIAWRLENIQLLRESRIVKRQQLSKKHDSADLDSRYHLSDWAIDSSEDDEQVSKRRKMSHSAPETISAALGLFYSIFVPASIRSIINSWYIDSNVLVLIAVSFFDAALSAFKKHRILSRR